MLVTALYFCTRALVQRGITGEFNLGGVLDLPDPVHCRVDQTLQLDDSYTMAKAKGARLERTGQGPEISPHAWVAAS